MNSTVALRVFVFGFELKKAPVFWGLFCVFSYLVLLNNFFFRLGVPRSTIYAKVKEMISK